MGLATKIDSANNQVIVDPNQFMGMDGLDKMMEFNNKIRIEEAIRQGKDLTKLKLPGLTQLGVQNKIQDKLSRYERQQVKRANFMAEKEE